MLVFPEDLKSLQKAFGNFLRLENTAGGGGGGGVVLFILWCQLPHSEGMKGLSLSFLLVFSSPRSAVMVGGRMRSQAGCGACGTGRTSVTFSQGERAEGFPELREQMTLPSAAGCAWPPPTPSRALCTLAGHRAVRFQKKQASEG